MKFRLFLKSFVICAMCFSIFTGFGYYYLNNNLKSVNQNTDNIPYTQVLSENKGILFVINGEETFIYLDFFENKATVSISPEESFAGQIYGYSHDYTVKGNDELIISIVDNIGGVELDIDGEKMRYTGLQVSDLIKRTNSIDFKRKLITVILEKIAKYGVDSSFVGDIINNSDTELNLAESYLWDEALDELCANTHFID